MHPFQAPDSLLNLYKCEVPFIVSTEFGKVPMVESQWGKIPYKMETHYIIAFSDKECLSKLKTRVMSRYSNLTDEKKGEIPKNFLCFINYADWDCIPVKELSIGDFIRLINTNISSISLRDYGLEVAKSAMTGTEDNN